MLPLQRTVVSNDVFSEAVVERLPLPADFWRLASWRYRLALTADDLRQIEKFGHREQHGRTR